MLINAVPRYHCLKLYMRMEKMVSELNNRTKHLLHEIKMQGKHACNRCICGAIQYPENWMKKTREQAEKDGILTRCIDCTKDTRLMLKVTIDPPREPKGER